MASQSLQNARTAHTQKIVRFVAICMQTLPPCRQNVRKPQVFQGFWSPEVSKNKKTNCFSRFLEPWGLKIQENLSHAQKIVRFAAICMQTLPPWRQNTRKPKVFLDFRSPEVPKYKKTTGFSRFPEPWGLKIQENTSFFKVSGDLRSQKIENHRFF